MFKKNWVLTCLVFEWITEDCTYEIPEIVRVNPSWSHPVYFEAGDKPFRQGSTWLVCVTKSKRQGSLCPESSPLQQLLSAAWKISFVWCRLQEGRCVWQIAASSNRGHNHSNLFSSYLTPSPSIQCPESCLEDVSCSFSLTPVSLHHSFFIPCLTPLVAEVSHILPLRSHAVSFFSRTIVNLVVIFFAELVKFYSLPSLISS